MESVAPDVGDALDSDLSAVPLDSTGHPGLAFLASRPDIALFSTDQGFVHFHNAEQGGSFKGVVPHGFPDTVAEIPGGVFRPDSQGALKLAEETPFLATHMR